MLFFCLCPKGSLNGLPSNDAQTHVHLSFLRVPCQHVFFLGSDATSLSQRPCSHLHMLKLVCLLVFAVLGKRTIGASLGKRQMPGYTWHGYTWNNKGRPSGTGTVSRARAEKFKKKGEERVAREKAEAEEKARQEEQKQSAPSSLAKREEEKPAGPSTLDKREEGQPAAPSSLAKREEEKPAETSTLDKREEGQPAAPSSLEEKPAEPTLVKREEGQPAASSTFLKREEEKPAEPTLDKREGEQPAPSTLVKREEEKPAEPSPLDKREETKEQQAQDKEPTSEALGKAPSKNKQAKDQKQGALVLGPSPAQKSKELVAAESSLEDSVDWGTSSETESCSQAPGKQNGNCHPL